MNSRKLFALMMLSPLASACSHSSTAPVARNAASGAPEASGPEGEAEPASPSVRPEEGEALGSKRNAPAAAPRSARASRADNPPLDEKLDRPGLGTTWGETRSSYVSNQAFDRADFEHPFALVTLNYNDEAGVRAMARRAGNSYASFESSNVDVGQGAMTVHVLDEHGAPLTHENIGGRDYVVGADGQRYTIQIENHSANRFEAVATVDGLDVVDGKDGSLGKRGYLIEPWATLEIDGFRRNQAEVAAFRFGAVRDAYAARKGNDRNVGVIGIAFFQQRGSSLPWMDRELDRRDAADPFPGRFAAPPPRAR